MRQRAMAIAVALGLAGTGLACSSAESNVVNQYFTALRANDTNTLTSFAMVAFDKKVDDYKIVSIGEEQKTPASLPDLVQKQKDLEAQQADNLKQFRAWGNDLAVYPKLDQVKEARSAGKKIPGSLQPIAEKYDAFSEKDRELKKAVAEAKDAVAHERRNTLLSIGPQFEDTVDQMKGDVISKEISLNLTINGQAQPYVMVLRKYDLDPPDGGRRMVSRWVVQSLVPKA